MDVHVGGYWATNLGDDLFLKVLCERYPNITFHIQLYKENKAVFENIPNLVMHRRIVGKNKFTTYMMTIFEIIKNKFSKRINGLYLNIGPFLFFQEKPDTYIEIGGSMFMIDKDIDVKKSRPFKTRMKIRDTVNNFFVLGTNFGPYNSEQQKNDYSFFFSRTTDTCFRDKASYEIFSSLSNVRYEADIVLSLSPIKSKNMRKYIVISIIDLNEKKDVDDVLDKDNSYEKWLIDIVKEYSRQGEHILLFSFCDSQGDNKMSERIADSLTEEQIAQVSLYSHKNIEDSLEVISKSKKIIATRFHSMILGWVNQIPTFVISYSQKTDNAIKSCFPEQNYVEMKNICDISFNDLESRFSIINSVQLDYLRNSAEKQFELLDENLR